MAEKIQSTIDASADIYRQLQQHLDQMPIGFPATKSGVELRILQHLFTPEEAKIAMLLRFGWGENMDSLDEIQNRVQMAGIIIDNLESVLDTMAKKGSITVRTENNQKYYSNAFLMVGMFEFQVNQLTEEFFKDVGKYLMEGYAVEFLSTRLNQLRTVPVEQSLTPDHSVGSYDDIKNLIETSEGPFSLSNCVCRQGMDIIGDSCKKTTRREVCLGFGFMAQMYIDLGRARSISKDEALNVLRMNQEDGLVLLPSNSARAQFVCSCCGCCCEMLKGISISPRPVDLIATNYRSEVNLEMCTGCGTCVERCQMKALKLVDEISTVNLKRCIGCGVCVPTCASDAIRLVKKEKEIVPPETFEELLTTMKTVKETLKEKKLAAKLKANR